MSTATASTAVSRMTRDDAQILAHYAAAETSRQICAALGIDMETVGYCLDRFAGGSRERAHGLVLEYSEQHQQEITVVPAPKPAVVAEALAPPAPAKADPPKPAPAKSVAVRRRDPRMAAPAPKTDPVPVVVIQAGEHIDGVVDLLDAAVATGNPQLKSRADNIRDLISKLQKQLAEHSRNQEVIAELRDEQAKLEARLAEIASQLSAVDS